MENSDIAGLVSEQDLALKKARVHVLRDIMIKGKGNMSNILDPLLGCDSLIGSEDGRVILCFRFYRDDSRIELNVLVEKLELYSGRRQGIWRQAFRT